MIEFFRKIKARPLEYLVKAIHPVLWVRRIAYHYINVRRYPRRRRETVECIRVFDALNKMNGGNFQDLKESRNYKLLRILQYASKHTPFYRNLFQQAGFDPSNLKDFGKIPFLNKATIRNHWNELISDEIDSMDTYRMNTGGSTGEPLEFMVARFAGLIDRVHQEFVYRMSMHYKPGDLIVAFDGSTVPPESLDSNIYWVVTSDRDIPYGRLSYSSLYLTAQTIPYYIKNILDIKPSILRGYPSFFNDIAEYILENSISIPFQIKGIQLTAENVYDWQIENIQKAFNTQVFMQYGHSEVCVYGYTFDNTHEYYCSPLYGFTEVLSDDGKHVNQGEVGEVVVTSFYNFAMPFIRYRTGDLALYNGDIDGIVRLGKIIGRTQDFIYKKNREKVALTALIFGQHYRSFRNIKKWQLQQDIPGKVKVRIIKDDGFLAENEKEIRGKFKDICDVDAEFEYVEAMTLTPRGKFRFLIQNVKS